MSWDDLESEERWGDITPAGVEWLKENDPGRHADMKASGIRRPVKILSDMGELREVQFRNRTIVHIPAEYVEVR